MSEQPEQIGREALRELDPTEVRAALEQGRLVELLAGRDPGSVAHAAAGDGEHEREEEPRPPPTDPDLGARGGAPGGQVRRDDLHGMTGEEIRDALRDGKLDSVLKGDA